MSTVMLERLSTERQGCLDFIAKTIEGAESATRDLSKSERETLDKTKTRISELDEQIKPLAEFAELQTAARSATSQFTPTAPEGPGRVQITQNPTDRAFKYRDVGQFLADGYRAYTGDRVAADRLESEGIKVDNGVMHRVVATQTTTETPGLLPVTLQGEMLNELDASRPFLSSMGVKDLGGVPGTTFKRPILTQHVNVTEQTTQLAEIGSRQFTVSSVDFVKKTYGGVLSISRQDIDWTSPAAWNAIMADFMDIYAITTDDACSAAWATGITQTQELTTALAGTPTLAEFITALYQAAVKVYTGTKKLPDAIWMSIDQWALYGSLISIQAATTAGNGGGTAQPTNLVGDMLSLPRYVVPALTAGTTVVGRKDRYEAYEDRIGFLSAVQPKLLGIEVAYGGYVAANLLKATAFCKIVNAA